MIQKFVYFALILILLMQEGCYCKIRSFVAEQGDVPVMEHWSIIATTYDLYSCSAKDYINCDARLKIDTKYLDDDSLKNMAVRMDSLVLMAGDSVYKKVNDKPKFQYARNNKVWQKEVFKSQYFELLENDEVYAYFPYPEISRDIKEVYMTVYVSFKFPEDGHIESKEVKVKLKEKNTVRVGPFLFD